LKEGGWRKIMGKKITQNSWLHDPKVNKQSDCAEDLEEFEKFIQSDQIPVEASQAFKKNLREKLWDILKNKHYIFFAFMVFFFS
jgi:hypothetical protein